MAAIKATLILVGFLLASAVISRLVYLAYKSIGDAAYAIIFFPIVLIGLWILLYNILKGEDT